MGSYTNLAIALAGELVQDCRLEGFERLRFTYLKGALHKTMVLAEAKRLSAISTIVSCRGYLWAKGRTDTSPSFPQCLLVLPSIVDRHQ